MNLRPARWGHPGEGGRVVCGLCPRACSLAEGQKGFCGVRLNEGNALRTTVGGGTSGLCVDPIEKKPLFHFLPGTEVLSFGTLGCNLGCLFCQNWELSRVDQGARMRASSPEEIVRLALARRCSGVAFTYNEPIVSAEFCLEVAQACREAGLKTVAVTGGYISSPAREAFFQAMDAANVDLKGFSEDFYHRYCSARLAPVLETLAYLARETRVWTEVTTLLIPGANDATAELEALASWVAEHLGPDVPLHFSAFHPAHRLLDRPRTPLATLQRARTVALAKGLRFVYLGNLWSEDGGTTFCPGCGSAVITREGFRIASFRLEGNACPACGTVLPGRFGP
ncbi:MAG TPA: AmmeMemoRadiSam system radical SAM enzyme [Holophaga sp.]|nr:AmmeMemoRadiSam system radical SAM enzyme [Holophaga sp.]HPS66519.1 AmmeMemoRadiSam system radical SAM enzyme [Holophaga sp.]